MTHMSSAVLIEGGLHARQKCSMQFKQSSLVVRLRACRQ